MAKIFCIYFSMFLSIIFMLRPVCASETYLFETKQRPLFGFNYKYKFFFDKTKNIIRVKKVAYDNDLDVWEDNSYQVEDGDNLETLFIEKYEIDKDQARKINQYLESMIPKGEECLNSLRIPIPKALSEFDSQLTLINKLGPDDKELLRVPIDKNHFIELKKSKDTDEVVRIRVGLNAIVDKDGKLSKFELFDPDTFIVVNGKKELRPNIYLQRLRLVEMDDQIVILDIDDTAVIRIKKNEKPSKFDKYKNSQNFVMTILPQKNMFYERVFPFSVFEQTGVGLDVSDSSIGESNIHWNSLSDAPVIDTFYERGQLRSQYTMENDKVPGEAPASLIAYNFATAPIDLLLDASVSSLVATVSKLAGNDLIKDSIMAEVKNVEVINDIFSEEKVEELVDEIIKEAGPSTFAPKNNNYFPLYKISVKKFSKAIVTKYLEGFTKSEDRKISTYERNKIGLIVNNVISDLHTCLDASTDRNGLSDCTRKFTRSAPYRVGKAAVEYMVDTKIADVIGDKNISGKAKTVATYYFDSCAADKYFESYDAYAKKLQDVEDDNFNRNLFTLGVSGLLDWKKVPPEYDGTAIIKNCAKKAILLGVNQTINSVLQKELKGMSFTPEDSEKLRKDVLNLHNLCLTKPDGEGLVVTNGYFIDFNDDAIASIPDSGKGGFEELLMGCVKKTVKISGEKIVRNMISTHEAINSVAKNNTQKKEIEDYAIVNLRKCYKKQEELYPDEMVDPNVCKRFVLNQSLGLVMEKALVNKVKEMFSSRSDLAFNALIKLGLNGDESSPEFSNPSSSNKTLKNCFRGSSAKIFSEIKRDYILSKESEKNKTAIQDIARQDEVYAMTCVKNAMSELVYHIADKAIALELAEIEQLKGKTVNFSKKFLENLKRDMRNCIDNELDLGSSSLDTFSNDIQLVQNYCILEQYPKIVPIVAETLIKSTVDDVTSEKTGLVDIEKDILVQKILNQLKTNVSYTEIEKYLEKQVGKDKIKLKDKATYKKRNDHLSKYFKELLDTFPGKAGELVLGKILENSLEQAVDDELSVKKYVADIQKNIFEKKYKIRITSHLNGDSDSFIKEEYIDHFNSISERIKQINEKNNLPKDLKEFKLKQKDTYDYYVDKFKLKYADNKNEGIEILNKYLNDQIRRQHYINKNFKKEEDIVLFEALRHEDDHAYFDKIGKIKIKEEFDSIIDGFQKEAVSTVVKSEIAKNIEEQLNDLRLNSDPKILSESLNKEASIFLEECLKIDNERPSEQINDCLSRVKAVVTYRIMEENIKQAIREAFPENTAPSFLSDIKQEILPDLEIVWENELMSFGNKTKPDLSMFTKLLNIYKKSEFSFDSNAKRELVIADLTIKSVNILTEKSLEFQANELKLDKESYYYNAATGRTKRIIIEDGIKFRSSLNNYFKDKKYDQIVNKYKKDLLDFKKDEKTKISDLEAIDKEIEQAEKALEEENKIFQSQELVFQGLYKAKEDDIKRYGKDHVSGNSQIFDKSYIELNKQSDKIDKLRNSNDPFSLRSLKEKKSIALKKLNSVYEKRKIETRRLQSIPYERNKDYDEHKNKMINNTFLEATANILPAALKMNVDFLESDSKEAKELIKVTELKLRNCINSNINEPSRIKSSVGIMKVIDSRVKGQRTDIPVYDNIVRACSTKAVMEFAKSLTNLVFDRLKSIRHSENDRKRFNQCFVDIGTKINKNADNKALREEARNITPIYKMNPLSYREYADSISKTKIHHQKYDQVDMFAGLLASPEVTTDSIQKMITECTDKVKGLLLKEVKDEYFTLLNDKIRAEFKGTKAVTLGIPKSIVDLLTDIESKVSAKAKEKNAGKEATKTVISKDIVHTIKKGFKLSSDKIAKAVGYAPERFRESFNNFGEQLKFEFNLIDYDTDKLNPKELAAKLVKDSDGIDSKEDLISLVIKSEVYQELKKEIPELQKSERLDKSIIDDLVNKDLIEKIFSSEEGIEGINGLKEFIRQSADTDSESPDLDKAMSKLKKAIAGDVSKGGFVQKLLKAFFNKEIKAYKEGVGTSRFPGLFLSAKSKDFKHVYNRPSGRKAVKFLSQHILTPYFTKGTPIDSLKKEKIYIQKLIKAAVADEGGEDYSAEELDQILLDEIEWNPK